MQTEERRERSSGGGGDGEGESPSFLGKDGREKCWAARDAYHLCLDRNGDARDRCLAEFKVYAECCPQAWVKHFEKKRLIDRIKQRQLQSTK
ncbi:Cytochrome c oxidase assembly factor 6 [Balamuthia mandrillaris]